MFAAEVVNPVEPDVPAMVWGAIFFFILLILMYSVCLPPIRKAIRQRAEQQRLDEETAERARTEAEQVRRDYDATLADAHAEAAQIVDDARAAAEAERSRRVAEVDAELAAERQAVMAELETQRAAALEGLKVDVTSLATAAASKVVDRELDAGAQQAVIDEFVAAATRS